MKKVIEFIAPTCFGVYIIHEHPLIKTNFETWFGWAANLNLLSEIAVDII